MNAVFGAERLWQLAGWTMLHYLWIGAALGLVAFAVRRATRRLSPGVRYGVAVLSLSVLVSAPFAIAVYLRGTKASITFDETPLEREQHVKALPLPAGFTRFGLGSGPAASARSNANDSGEPARSLTERFEETIEPLVSRLPWIWLAGTPLCLLVVMSGLYGAERMRRGAVLVIDGPVAQALERSQEVLAVGRAVAVAVSDRIVSPLVLGIVRPLILLPASAVAGWTPDQLQMILLHELAHVRRWDNLVNLVQRIVEAALFYQPAVWLVSNWVRLEREHCCDAVVLAQGNEPQEYAETLASLAMPGISPRYAAAALASHQLVSRIRHILNVEDRSMKVSRRALLTLVCGAVLFSSLVAVYAQQQADKPLQAPSDETQQIEKEMASQEKTANDLSDADRELTLLRSHRNRLMAARRQVQNLAELYNLGKITPDFYADAVRREADASQEYARAFQTLLERIMQRGKIDPASHQLLKTLVLMEGGDLRPATQEWAAAQLIGPPDAEPGREDRRAWSSATPDGQSEWIELVYEKPVEAVAVVITESYNPGAIGSVKSFDANGKWQWVVENTVARPVDKDRQVTTIPLSTERPVAKIRITIESVSVPGYNQIDAVGLLDAKGKMHWATSATASSDRSQPKSATDATFDGSVLKALELMGHGAHEHVDVKNLNCQNCHQIQSGSDAYSNLQTLFRGVAPMRTPDQSATTTQTATSAASVREKQELERQERLKPLRKEIEEINQEINKIKEELDLQSQRDKSRIELERLRSKLEENRKAR